MMSKSSTKGWMAAGFWCYIFLAFPAYVFACEPAVHLARVLLPLSISKSIYLVGATIILKCAAFAYLEKDLPWWKAVSFLFLANLYSTCIGLVAILPTVIPMCLPFLLIITGLTYLPAQRLVKHKRPDADAETIKRIALGLSVVATLLFLIGMMASLTISNQGFRSHINAGSYLAAKIVLIYTGLIIGIFLTIFYEEWLVARLAKRGAENPPFLTSVSRANYIALAFLMIVTAIMVLPERIRTGDWGLIFGF